MRPIGFCEFTRLAPNMNPLLAESIDNLDALSAPLARISVQVRSVVVADVDIREDGLAIVGNVMSMGLDKPKQACVE